MIFKILEKIKLLSGLFEVVKSIRRFNNESLMLEKA